VSEKKGRERGRVNIGSEGKKDARGKDRKITRIEKSAPQRGE